MIYRENILEAVKYYADQKCFLFDMDGLIFDTERLFMEQLAVVMKEEGYHLTRKVYLQTLGTNGKYLENIMKSHYGKDYPFERLSQETAKRIKMVAQTVGLAIKPHVRETLLWLKENHKPCAIASSTKSQMVKYYLETAEIEKYFEKIIGGEMVTNTKPDPEIFKLASQKMGFRPEECVVLEDSENGIKAGALAGCSVVCVPDMKQPAKDYEKYISIYIKY